MPNAARKNFTDSAQRVSLRAHFASRGIFTSIHWPTHEAVMRAGASADIKDTRWLEEHILSIPVSDDYSLDDMAAVCEIAAGWRND